MILAIRTDKPEAELYLISNGKVASEIKWEAHRELADTLLIKINELLKSKNISQQYIKGIIMHTGEGSFTGLRIGTTVANAMAYSLSIPIVAVKGGEWIKSGLVAIGSAKVGDLVVPEYNAEPNITKPKGS